MYRVQKLSYFPGIREKQEYQTNLIDVVESFEYKYDIQEKSWIFNAQLSDNLKVAIRSAAILTKNAMFCNKICPLQSLLLNIITFYTPYVVLSQDLSFPRASFPYPIKYIYNQMINLNESNFIFGDAEDQPTPPSTLENSQQARQLEKQEAVDLGKPPKLQPTYIQSQLIVVHPIQQTSEKTEEGQEEIVEQQYKSQQFKEEKRQDNIVFPYQESEQLQEDPQSSIRKLYKAMKREQREIQLQEVQVSREKEELYESHHYQQQDEQIQEEYQTKTQIRSESLRKLVLFSVPEKKLVRCLVKIATDSLFSTESVFHLYLLEERRLLLTARKRGFRVASKFQIYGKEEGHVERIAVVRSNLSRTQYKLTVLPSMKKLDRPEEERCYLSYQTNILGLSQQRVEVIRPCRPLAHSDRFSDIKASYENCQVGRVQKFGSRLAEIDRDGRLVLDFGGEKVEGSSRNVIMEDQYGQAALLLGRRRQDLFLLDVMRPFNLLDGFFLALCSLDRKPFV